MLKGRVKSVKEMRKRIEKKDQEKETILNIEQLEVGFVERKQYKKVLNRISFQVREGEILGIVGESGSGKSITSLAIMDLLHSNGKVMHGKIEFLGEDLLSLKEEVKRRKKGKEIAMVFQEPMTSLNPLMKIGTQVEEVLAIHKEGKPTERKEQALDMLNRVGLKHPEEVYRKYPHELSGGMRQRVMIAMAMICKPRLLIADEPTTALDVTVQKQILALLKQLKEEYQTTIILISHDLGVIRSLCDRAIVMNEGDIVEEGTTEALFENPKHEYTKRLLQAVPRIERGQENESKKQVPLLSTKQLSVFYPMKSKRFWGKADKKQIVKEVSFQIKEGEIFGIVGESGSGKSTLAKAIVGLNTLTTGTMELQVKQPQMVFQDPYSSLNPAKTIGAILKEPLKIQKRTSKEEQDYKVKEMLVQVGLTEDYATRRITELSGGQRQRVAIALALMSNQKFIVLDEPVSALDVTIQDQILKLLKDLKQQYSLTYLFISHDLSVVYNLCDQIAVMKDGEIVEQGSKNQIYFEPKQEYTKQLLASILL